MDMKAAGFKTQNRNKLLFTAAIVIGLGVSGCTIERQPRGFVFDKDITEGVLEGLDNKTSIQITMGNPSLRSTFDDDVWYYMYELTRRRSFFKAHAIERNIMAIYFDDDGVVMEKRNYSLADARNIKPRKDTTPTRGKKLGIFEQIFSNIGRFSADPTR